ncbi:MAG: efflux RND transporter periplasmic adaptor subunit [Acidobacteriota bacterium]|nr:efflux RND transporter periplasmic adaptor subunit [Acidobacteriota bacterium]
MKLLVPAVPLVLAATLWSCGGSSPQPAATARPAIEASVARVAVGDLTRAFEAGGVVRARTTAVIVSKVMAEVREVRVRPGDRVRAGQTLVTLDGRELDALAARARAAFTAARDGTQAARSDQAAARAALTLATAWHDRVASLRAKDSATPQELDEAVARLHEAQARVDGTTARVAEADAALAAARAAMEAASVGASYTVLTAPFDGVVTEKRVEPGNMASPGLPLLTVEDTRAFRLEVRLDESRASGITVGETADVAVDTLPGADGQPAARWVPARVAEMARTLDPGGHTFLVKLDLPMQPGLRSGMFGRARFPGETRRALTIPAASLLQRGQLTAVFVVDKEGVARFRPVTTGETSGGRVEVLAGVDPGETVVVGPPPDLQDGSPVHARPAAPAAGGTR